MSVNFNISGHHLEVTEPLQEYAKQKLAFKQEKYYDNITQINITLRVEHLEQSAEAEIHMGGTKHPIFAKSTTDDMYKSIDDLSHKLSSQIKKYHDKLRDHH